MSWAVGTTAQHRLFLPPLKLGGKNRIECVEWRRRIDSFVRSQWSGGGDVRIWEFGYESMTSKASKKPTTLFSLFKLHRRRRRRRSVNLVTVLVLVMSMIVEAEAATGTKSYQIRSRPTQAAALRVSLSLIPEHNYMEDRITAIHSHYTMNGFECSIIEVPNSATIWIVFLHAIIHSIRYYGRTCME